MYVYTDVYAYINIQTLIYTCVYIYVICVYVYTNIHVYVLVYVYLYIYMGQLCVSYVNIYIHIYTCISVCIYISTITPESLILNPSRSGNLATQNPSTLHPEIPNFATRPKLSPLTLNP